MSIQEAYAKDVQDSNGGIDRPCRQRRRMKYRRRGNRILRCNKHESSFGLKRSSAQVLGVARQQGQTLRKTGTDTDDSVNECMFFCSSDVHPTKTLTDGTQLPAACFVSRVAPLLVSKKTKGPTTGNAHTHHTNQRYTVPRRLGPRSRERWVFRGLVYRDIDPKRCSVSMIHAVQDRSFHVNLSVERCGQESRLE